MPMPNFRPIGLHLSQTAKAVSRAFDQALTDAGGTLPIWLILIGVKSGRASHQRALASFVGVEGATLTHHLNTMENQGLLTRRRDPANRRAHVVELTPRGEELFGRLRAAAVGFDRRLRQGLENEEIDQLTRTLDRMRANVANTPDAPQGSPAGVEDVHA
jgi:MarR family transcriptional regulator, transcriptional regulator for hemolysin